MLVLTAVIAMLSGGAEAMPASAVTQADLKPRAGRELYVCARDEASRRAFKREHGQVIFVSAKEAADSKGWDTPRCITAGEYRRLTAMVGEVRWARD
ncbi:hypothetical protein [Caulobacter sp. NIBR1757]|uniref:hypothetical protein n=1 Tax=Caulobacter sp. NIBR1757 TaxID=3016000 RepID=UPI0022F10299|nr:hypothetical protein [Caulobacter sp. NIBR1757]WGM37639.1 hypothetical protein AMEJIAPC_00538 [Caulobacter sp. NIBR1757]